MKTSGLLYGIAVLAMLTLTTATSADQAKPTPGESMLDPSNHTMILIDHQPQMAFATKSIDIVELRNNVTGLAKAAKAFDVPTILAYGCREELLRPLVPRIEGGISGTPAH